jgi:PAS domain-containing protein
MMACPGQDCSPIAERERVLIDAIGAAVYTTDAEGRLTYYNTAAAALWGWFPPLGRQLWSGA